MAKVTTAKKAKSVKKHPKKKWYDLSYLKIDHLPERRSDLIGWGLIILSYVIYVSWALLSTGTWDGDCATRYFNALNAFQEPINFVQLWNRPLWITIFAGPVQISRHAIPIIMSTIAGLGAFSLYKAARINKIQFAFVVIPLLLFQPYFLGTARDALTEPLAAAIIAMSFYALKTQRWIPFVLLGALLPLSRTELVLHLIFWVIPLIQYRKWHLIPLLGAGLVVWSIAAGIISGDWFYLYSKTIGSELESNRYGSQPFNTYFDRLFYVIGPVVFYFAVLGIVRSVVSRSVQMYVEIQLAFGLLLYTIFAWKIVIGQSAGFLRNLIPLSPLIAITAVNGFNFWILSLFQKRKAAMLLASSLAGVLVYAFYRNTLRMHHIKTDEIGHLHLSIVAALILLGFIPWRRIVGKDKNLRFYVAIGLTGIVGISTMAYAMITEPPDANMNAERRMLDEVAEIYRTTSISQAPMIYCSHSWFYWSAGVNRNSEGFSGIWRDSIVQAPDESVVIWESHFSNRIAGDIPMSYFENTQNGFAKIAVVYADDQSRAASIYIKKAPGTTDGQYIDAFIESNPARPEGLVSKAEYYLELGDIANALVFVDKALAVQPEEAYAFLLKGQILSNEGNYAEAIEALNLIGEEMQNNLNFFRFKGTALFNLGRYEESKRVFDQGIAKKSDFAEFHYNAGISLVMLGRTSEACVYFTRAKNLNYSAADAMLLQHCQ